MPFLGDGSEVQEAAARYRILVQLVVTAANDSGTDEERNAAALRSYARWVKISLRMLAADGRVPPIDGGSPEHPVLGMADHMPRGEVAGTWRLARRTRILLCRQ